MAKVNILNKKNSVLNNFLRELRDDTLQKDKMRFRRNLERCGEVLAYEISKELDYQQQEVKTPLGDTEVALPVALPFVVSILRAGLPLHQGLMRYFDQADNGFVSAYRKHHREKGFEVHVEYLSSQDLENKTMILADPMLATGNSLLASYKSLTEEFGEPVHTHIASVIASQEGIDFVKRNLPKNVSFWVCAVDDELTAQGYIVPGLGDAGDLAFGNKE